MTSRLLSKGCAAFVHQCVLDIKDDFFDSVSATLSPDEVPIKNIGFIAISVSWKVWTDVNHREFDWAKFKGLVSASVSKHLVGVSGFSVSKWGGGHLGT